MHICKEQSGIYIFLPPESAGVLLAIRDANRSYCRAIVLTQRVAPNAKPDATSG